MCTGACSRVLGAALWPFALLCIVCNIVLAFPDWKTQYVHHWGEYLTPEILYLGGIIGGGIMVMVPAVHIQATGRKGCCGNRCGMCLSIIFAAVGALGGIYAVATSSLGLVHGPMCQYPLANGTLEWGRPFESSLEDFSEKNYLFDTSLWDVCRDPPGVTRFNVILFSIILASGLVEFCLCALQILNGLFGCVCGTCNEEEKETYH
ncbi:transmembrane 4 L6 family member 5-like isoform X2 [Podarcis raffonei]|uniref:transmembrane 4 L6 family member 5-like isoform X2 n=1 Tax=Podarcis raffonei TaxID=65483 RepID=UPI0023298253|nr:transmembrane 4 L6 family member 5-like isoform X2 [Podarcis raffonei]